MRLEALKSFTHLVREGSYPAASEVLFLSPTTIHGHVKSLEDELQATLVHFNGRKLELSQAGSRFFVFAERMLEERAKMERDILGLSRPETSRLRIMSLHGPSVHLLPPVVAAFHRAQPNVLISVTSGGVGDCAAALASGQCDIALLNDSHEDEYSGAFSMTPLYEDSLEFIIRSDYYEEPALDLLSKYPLAIQPSGSNYRQQVEKWARREGITLQTAYEHTSFDGLLAFVLLGACVGMVGGYIPHLSMADGRLRTLDLPNFSFRRRVCAMHPVRPLPLITEFLGFFRDFYDGRGAVGPSEISNAVPGKL